MEKNKKNKNKTNWKNYIVVCQNEGKKIQVNGEPFVKIGLFVSLCAKIAPVNVIECVKTTLI